MHVIIFWSLLTNTCRKSVLYFVIECLILSWCTLLLYKQSDVVEKIHTLQIAVYKNIHTLQIAVYMFLPSLLWCLVDFYLKHYSWLMGAYWYIIASLVDVYMVLLKMHFHWFQLHLLSCTWSVNCFYVWYHAVVWVYISKDSLHCMW